MSLIYPFCTATSLNSSCDKASDLLQEVAIAFEL